MVIKLSIWFMQLPDADLPDVGKAALGVTSCLSLSSELAGFCRPGFNYCIHSNAGIPIWNPKQNGGDTSRTTQSSNGSQIEVGTLSELDKKALDLSLGVSRSSSQLRSRIPNTIHGTSQQHVLPWWCVSGSISTPLVKASLFILLGARGRELETKMPEWAVQHIIVSSLKRWPQSESLTVWPQLHLHWTEECRKLISLPEKCPEPLMVLIQEGEKTRECFLLVKLTSLFPQEKLHL